ncbi:MAG: efflux RND transporter periplasmic adaptor subunit, partial [Bacteroidia bacterium]|nr:efflux RND transporter periplasmic adaptor subunit [Bacteroidia bacterium]
EGHTGEIVFSEAQQEAFGIEVEEVAFRPFSSVIRTSGTILSASGEEAVISATTSGVFHFSGKAPTEGSYIAKGSVFAVINTQNVDGGDPVSKARAALETAEKEYQRDIELLKDNIISISHYDQSKLEYEQAKAAYEALTSGGYSGGGLNVLSPLSGYVRNIYVSEGQYVNTGEALAVLSQNRKLQLRAELPEKYYSLLKDIVSANFVTSDGKVWSLDELGGRILSYSRSSSNHFLPVTFEFDNRVSAAPGSYVDIYLKGREQQDAIVVPVEAVTESQGVYNVFVQHEEDAFLKRQVEIGSSDGLNVQILSGLTPGDKVVVKGAVQIKLASVSAVPSGHNHQH